MGVFDCAGGAGQRGKAVAIRGKLGCARNLAAPGGPGHKRKKLQRQLLDRPLGSRRLAAAMHGLGQEGLRNQRRGPVGRDGQGVETFGALR